MTIPVKIIETFRITLNCVSIVIVRRTPSEDEYYFRVYPLISVISDSDNFPKIFTLNVTNNKHIS